MAPPAAAESTITSCFLTGQGRWQNRMDKWRLCSASCCGQAGSPLTLEIRVFRSSPSPSTRDGMGEGYTSMPTSCLHLQTTPLQPLLQGGHVHKVTPLTGPCVSDSSRGKNSRVLTSSEGQRQVQSSRAPGRSVLAHPSFCPELLWANLYQAGEASTPLTRAGQDFPRTPLSNHPLGLGGSSRRK